MYPVPKCFEPRDEADVIDLVTRHPLAWVVAPDLSAILLPVRPAIDRGRLIGFRGHMPRRISARFSRGGDALLLFTGPSAYISPSWFTDRKLAPTWSSASAAFRCSIELSDDPAELRENLIDLVDAMERGRPAPWRLDELGDRYDRLARRIIAFRAVIAERRAAFRLGQDEDDQTFSDLLAGLRAEGNRSFADMMAEFRPSGTARSPAAGADKGRA